MKRIKVNTMITVALFLCLMTLVRSADAKVIVFPFAVHNQVQKSHHWLGEAFAFYLSSGLRMNETDVLPYQKVKYLLKMNDVQFPVGITKASMIHLSRSWGADTMIWGEIYPASSAGGAIRIKAVLLDVKGIRQFQLTPSIGRIDNLYLVLKRLLDLALVQLKQQSSSWSYPDLGLGFLGFERLVKSYLVTDIEQKLALLNEAKSSERDSDYINFELAKIHFEKNDLVQTSRLLDDLADSVVLRDERRFLRALILMAEERVDEAINLFITLQDSDDFHVETHNNLGLLYLKKGKFSAAQKCFDYALSLSRDWEIALNHVHHLLMSDKMREAKEVLIRTLVHFPNQIELIYGFHYFLNLDGNSAVLQALFNEFIPEASVDVSFHVVPRIKNPFQPHTADVVVQTDPGAEPNLFESDTEDMDVSPEALQIYRSQLESNPFIHITYRLIAELYLKRNDLEKAEAYARCACFLESSRENRDLLNRITDLIKRGRGTVTGAE